MEFRKCMSDNVALELYFLGTLVLAMGAGFFLLMAYPICEAFDYAATETCMCLKIQITQK